MRSGCAECRAEIDCVGKSVDPLADIGIGRDSEEGLSPARRLEVNAVALLSAGPSRIQGHAQSIAPPFIERLRLRLEPTTRRLDLVDPHPQFSTGEFGREL